MTLGNIIDFIHSNCYPYDGYIRVMQGQKIRIVLDSTCSENDIIDIVKFGGVWTASLKLNVGIIANSVEEIDDTISDLRYARQTFSKITTYLENWGHKSSTQKDVNLGPFARVGGTPSFGTFGLYTKPNPKDYKCTCQYCSPQIRPVQSESWPKPEDRRYQQIQDGFVDEFAKDR